MTKQKSPTNHRQLPLRTKQKSPTFEQKVETQVATNNRLLGELHERNKQANHEGIKNNAELNVNNSHQLTQGKENIGEQPMQENRNAQVNQQFVNCLVKDQLRYKDERDKLQGTVQCKTEEIEWLKHLLEESKEEVKRQEEEKRKLKEQLSLARKNEKYLKQKLEGAEKAALEQTTSVATGVSKKVVDASKKSEKKRKVIRLFQNVGFLLVTFESITF